MRISVNNNLLSGLANGRVNQRQRGNAPISFTFTGARDGYFKASGANKTSYMSYSGNRIKPKLSLSNNPRGNIECELSEGVEDVDISSLKGYNSSSANDISIYYKGKLINQSTLVKEAVNTGAITLEEGKSFYGACKESFQKLIADKATPLYSWSTTLYSEDGKYMIRTDADGNPSGGFTITEAGNGKDIFDYANKLAGGESIGRDIWWMRRIDRELYDAAKNIGDQLFYYEAADALHQAGGISNEQFSLHTNLIKLLFGLSGNDNQVRNYIKEVEKQGNYMNLLSNYRPEVAIQLCRSNT